MASEKVQNRCSASYIVVVCNVCLTRFINLMCAVGSRLAAESVAGSAEDPALLENTSNNNLSHVLHGEQLLPVHKQKWVHSDTVISIDGEVHAFV